MSDPDNKEPHDKKKVTAATTDAPQEEFIAPESIPSKTESGREKESTAERPDPPAA